jgi:glucose/mannose-6-phosphate isomerase
VTTTDQQALDRETISRVDVQDHLTDVLALPEHLRDALWKTESAQLGEWDSPGGLIVAGMGPSNMGGQLARAALGDHASRPILSSRAYGLPPWTTPDTTVLCASYSGDTEETLASFEAAGALGARRVVATSGGRLAEEARAAGVPVIPIAGGYLAVAARETAAACGAGPRIVSDIDVAAEHLEQLVVAWGPDAPEDSPAKALARALHGTVPVVVGAGVTTPIALRWKSAINENAKQHAFWNELPELDHNEVGGWEGSAELGRFSAIFLADADTHPRINARWEVTAELIRGSAAAVHQVETVGTTPIERVLSAVLLGDLVSLYLAVLRGVDPTPAGAIGDVRRLLAGQ